MKQTQSTSSGRGYQSWRARCLSGVGRLWGPLGNNSGLTMIEILVSIIVLAVLVVPLADSLVVGRTFTAHRGEKRMALRLVERKAEQLMAAGYASAGPDNNILSTNMAVGAHPISPSIVVNTRGDTDNSNDVFGDLNWYVSRDAYAAGSDSVRRKIVEIRLRWPSGAPRDSVSVMTLVGSG
ncbi:MAG: prepilin-type N-terminal cleavage/methylation domain-containing protein [Candidatus Eisenbacteria bacterium]